MKNLLLITSLLLLQYISLISQQEILNLSFPNGGEKVFADTDTTINWEGFSIDDSVSIDFTSNGGNSWDKLVSSAVGNKYNWQIPNIESDSCLIKINQLVNNKVEPKVVWSKSYGGSKADLAFSVEPTDDGGCIVVGISESIDFDVSYNYDRIDYWILKLDKEGLIEWEKVLGGSGGDYARDVLITKDGGYLIAGYSSSRNKIMDSNYGNPEYGSTDGWIIKLDKNGEIIWKKNYGGSGSETIYSVIESNDGSYVFAGGSASFDFDLEYAQTRGYDDIWITKITPQGEIIWTKTYGGSSGEFAFSIIENKDGGLVLTGQTYSKDYNIPGNHGYLDLVALKTNSTGELEWIKTFGGSKYDVGINCILATDGGYIIAGYSDSKDGDITNAIDNNDFWVVKLFEDGTMDWNKKYGTTSTDICSSISATPDGGYIVSGYTGAGGTSWFDEGVVLKIDKVGETIWTKNFGGSSTENLYVIRALNETDFLAVGRTNSNDGDLKKNNGDSDYWILKLTSGKQPLQIDTSDRMFSIIKAKPQIYRDTIDMGSLFIGADRDSIVAQLICNSSLAPLTVFGIDLSSGDLNDFSIIDGSNERTLFQNECADYTFVFTPTDSGARTALVTISTSVGQFTDTLVIIGNGVAVIPETFRFNVFPNVSSSDITVILNIVDAGETELVIYDNIGRKMQTLLTGNQEIGTRDLKIDIRDYQSGRYYLQLTTPTITKTEFIEVIR
ncbi:MAG: T9SS type A sorting domain-containing protein [Candidatus Kapaibacterium sp.]